MLSVSICNAAPPSKQHRFPVGAPSAAFSVPSMPDVAPPIFRPRPLPNHSSYPQNSHSHGFIKEVSVWIEIILSMHTKWSFWTRISSVNVTRSAAFCGFGHIYWRNPWCKTLFFVRCLSCSKSNMFLMMVISVYVFHYHLFLKAGRNFLKLISIQRFFSKFLRC